MGPYGPIWDHMGLPRQVFEKVSDFRQISVRLLDQFRTFRVQKLDFDEISKWFCIIFAGEAQKSRYFDQKP